MNITDDAPVKFPPEIIMAAPTLPDVGENEEIPVLVTVKVPELVAIDPTGGTT